MNLDELLAEVEGIGGDAYVPSECPPAEPAADTAPAMQPANAGAVQPSPPQTAPAGAVDTTPLADSAYLDALDMVLDVEFEVTVELGHARIPLKALLQMEPGYRFTLEQRTDELLKLYVNDQMIGRGEALIVNDSLAVRIVELIHSEENEH